MGFSSPVPAAAARVPGRAPGRRRCATRRGRCCRCAGSPAGDPHQYIPGAIFWPTSSAPYIRSARSGSFAACTRPACASRHTTGGPSGPAPTPRVSNNRSAASIARSVPTTWSRRTFSRSAGGCALPGDVCLELAQVLGEQRPRGVDLGGGRAIRTFENGSSAARSPTYAALHPLVGPRRAQRTPVGHPDDRRGDRRGEQQRVERQPVEIPVVDRLPGPSRTAVSAIDSVWSAGTKAPPTTTSVRRRSQPARRCPTCAR